MCGKEKNATITAVVTAEIDRVYFLLNVILLKSIKKMALYAIVIIPKDSISGLIPIEVNSATSDTFVNSARSYNEKCVPLP